MDNKKNDKINELDKLVARLENCGLEEYVRLSGKPWKIIWLNFLSGVSRGLGFTVGTAIVLAIAYNILKQLISMNIPYLTEVLKDVVELIRSVQ